MWPQGKAGFIHCPSVGAWRSPVAILTDTVNGARQPIGGYLCTDKHKTDSVLK